MKWLNAMNEKIKRGIYHWLNIQPSNPYRIQINESLDFEMNAIRNRIWFRGDGNELEQMYSSMPEYADRYKFWASRCSPGMEMRKIHTGIPALIIRSLIAVVLPDMNAFEFESPKQERLWEEIEKQNRFRRTMKRVVSDVLCVGDGAWKLVLDTGRSALPFIRWYPGDRVEPVYDGDELKELVFKTPYAVDRREYVLYEHYGRRYVTNELYCGELPVSLSAIPQTAELRDWSFDSALMLAVPLRFFESQKWEGRGGSVFDGKLDSFDALDEAWSQWMDALRAGRARTYIPESFIPRDPATGTLLKPNAFDNRFIAGDNNMSENAKNVICTEQPSIPHDSYAATYITALDLCLQGIISPSTLGIDVKKLDNAEAQREKEKTTLYTRNAIIEVLAEALPELIGTCIRCVDVLSGQTVEEVQVSIPFGEYANPSFESQVETVSKGKQGGIMSIEASVEELYGDSRDEEWKRGEVARLKAEQGIADMEEPAVSMSAEGGLDEGQSDESPVQNEQQGVSGPA